MFKELTELFFILVFAAGVLFFLENYIIKPDPEDEEEDQTVLTQISSGIKLRVLNTTDEGVLLVPKKKFTWLDTHTKEARFIPWIHIFMDFKGFPENEVLDRMHRASAIKELNNATLAPVNKEENLHTRVN